jgi:putative pyruvate formate lyase activating enzyme
LTGGESGGGSGTVFVSGCNLGCVFCQNRQISRATAGTTLGAAVDAGEFARICLALQERGAENINIVTGSHAVPAIAEGLRAAGKGRPYDTARNGSSGGQLTLPVLWNSSAYELPETLELLAGLIDVFLPDLKTLDSDLASRFFHAPDYPERASAAILKMIDLASGAGGRLPAVMIRHLVLPDHLNSTREVLRWFADHCAGRNGVLLSLMFQYTPDTPNATAGTGSGALRGRSSGLPDPVLDFFPPGRYVNEQEYRTALGWLEEFGIEDGYCQELVPETADWLPDFQKANPFPSELSRPVWHWRERFDINEVSAILRQPQV